VRDATAADASEAQPALDRAPLDVLKVHLACLSALARGNSLELGVPRGRAEPAVDDARA
jgi:hypothetical protein